MFAAKSVVIAAVAFVVGLAAAATAVPLVKSMFAVQQSLLEYPGYAQVTSGYTPAAGYYPLAPWAGLAVTCAYTAVAMGLATYVLRRRDV